MKTKEHTRQVRDKVVEKFKAGLGYKTITQALNISVLYNSSSENGKTQLQTYQDKAIHVN